MGIVTRMVSDLTGVEGEESEFISLIIRRAPGLDRTIALDVRPEELGDINEPGDICVVEIRKHGELQGHELVVTIAELAKVLPKGTDLKTVFDNARNVRGRRPGTRMT